MDFLRRYREPLVVLVLILLPFVFYLSHRKAPRDHHFFDRVVLWVSAPVQWVVVQTLEGTANAFHRYIALVDVEEENVALREENARLRAVLAQREEQVHENRQLRLLVGLQEEAPELPLVFAGVVATSPTPLFRSLRIDRGRRHGVTVGAAVVNHAGVVGRVGAVGSGWADVMLLADASSSVDVVVQRTRARARVRGTGADGSFGIDLEHLERTADVEPGDLLVTSGLGGTFPKGLPVGKVVSVEQRAFGLYQRARAVPAVDFRRLEAVMVAPRAASKGTATDPSPVAGDEQGQLSADIMAGTGQSIGGE